MKNATTRVTQGVLATALLILTATGTAHSQTPVNVQLTTPSTNVTGPFTVTIVFDQDIVGFDQSDIRVTNGDVLYFNAVTGNDKRVFTLEIEPITSGIVTIEVPQGSAHDTDGNAVQRGFLSVQAVIQADAPVITTNAMPPVNGPFEITITFPEPVTGFTIEDINITNGEASNFVGRDGETAYAATITPSGDGPVTITIPAGAGEDPDTNPTKPSAPFTLAADLTSPLPTITSSTEVPATGPFEIRITFREPVTEFDASDLEVVNATVSDFAGDGAVYTATITPTAPPHNVKTVTIDIAAGAGTDAGGNASLAAEQFSIEADTRGPKPEITSRTTGTVTEPFTITITFAEAVTGFHADDLQVAKGTVSDFTGAGRSYSALISPDSSGSVRIDIAARAAENAVGYPTRAAEQFTLDADTTGPKPLISATIRPPANRPFTITITFPEPVTGFTAADLVIARGNASEFTGAGAVFTALVTPSDSGTLTIDIPSGAALDANGYESQEADTFSIEVDITPPTGVITTEEPGPFKDPFTIKIVFSEPIQDLSLEDISISLGQVSDLEGTEESQTEYTALVTPEGSGTLTIELPPQTFYDYSGHWNGEPVRFEVGIDTVRPTVEITSDSDPPVKGPFPLTFSFSEEVTGFERDDVEFPTGAGWLQTLHQTGRTTYTGTARPTTTGQILVRVPEGAATDAIGHENEESEFQLSAFIDEDTERPRVQIWSTATSPVQGPFEIRIDFSKPVVGMTADKLTVTNGTIDRLTDRRSARTEYSTTLWPQRNGTVTVNLPAGAVLDDLGNPNQAAPEFSIETLLTPVPAVPTAGLMLLAAGVAAAGWRKRRQAART